MRSVNRAAPSAPSLQLMAGGKEKGEGNSLDEQLPPPQAPQPQQSQDRPSLQQPRLSLPHQEDKQEEDGKEEESEHTEVQISASQLLGEEGCACEGATLSPLITQCCYGGKKGKLMGALSSDFSFPQKAERLVWSLPLTSNFCFF